MRIRQARRRPAHLRQTTRRLAFLETLEARQLLAGDLVDTDVDLLSDVVVVGNGPTAPDNSSSVDLQANQAEGEAQPDLVQFAKDLEAAGVIFFGADWCPFCNEQKSFFSDGAEYLPFVEVTNANRSLNQTGIDEGISTFPTWEFPSLTGGQPTRIEGVLTLQEISTNSGVPIPTGEAPSIQPIADVSVQLNTPLHVAVNAYDPNHDVSGQPLTITVTSSNTNVVVASVVEGVEGGNRSARFVVQNRGEMIFQLYEERAPIPTAAFINAALNGDFDGTQFHRIVDNFVIQGGQVAGAPTIFDDFHPELQHASAGVLSYAKTSADDSGTTQFFITDRNTQGPGAAGIPTAVDLDFNHPIFGQLTEGDKVRQGIQRSVTGTGDANIPQVFIETVEIFRDTENGLVKLLPVGSPGETADITVTVSDPDGNTVTETFTVTLTEDLSDGAPFLVDEGLFPNADGSPQLSTVQNQPISIPLDAIDVEGDTFEFTASAVSNVANENLQFLGNTLTVTPPTGFIGVMEVRVTVFQPGNESAGSDSQVVPIAVLPTQPGVVDLATADDTGNSSNDNITSNTTVTVRVNSVSVGAVVELATSNGDLLGSTTATNSFVDFTVNLQAFGDGDLDLVATQRISGQTSPESAPLTLTIDTAAPDLGANPGPFIKQIGDNFQFDASTAEEQNSEFVVYALQNAPAGMTIDPDTGLVEWIPSPTQRGNFTPGITATDAAGNVSIVQTLDVTAEGPVQVAFRLEATDTNGDLPSSPFIVGETLLLKVFVQDVSETPDGIKNAYFDLVLPNVFTPAGSLTFGDHFTFDQQGLTGGHLDDVGAGSDLTAPATGEFLLVTIPVVVSDGGNYTLQLTQATRDTERLELGSGVVDPSEIFYGSTTLELVSPFVAADDQFSVDEDSEAVSLNVVGNDTFLDGFSGNLLITTIGAGPSLGQVQVSNNEVLYTPNTNVSGTDQFTYILTDNQGRGTVTGTVTVTIQPVNDRPTAVDDVVNNVAEGSVNNEIDVLGNDTDIDGDELTLLLVNTPANGTATPSVNNTFVRYTPSTNFEGTDTFTYVVSDNRGGTATGTVTVNVAGANDPPVANDDVATVAEDQDVVIDALANDDVVDGGETLSLVSASATSGTVVIANGKLTYSPNNNFNGSDRIIYTISDGNGFDDTATVFVTVAPVNDAPVANDDPSSGNINVVVNATNTEINVLANDTDIDGDSLTITSVSNFSNGGSASIVGNVIRYTPATDFLGVETFDYTIQDPTGETSTATVTVNVLEFQPGSLAGVVFLDSDGDGIRDAGESGLAGVTVALSGTDDQGSSVNATVVTDASGAYLFDGLRPGTYTIVETQPEVFSDGAETVGSQGGSLAANDTISLTLDEAEDGVGNNFAETGRAASYRSIHDLFRSTLRPNVFVAVDIATGEVLNQWTEGGWENAVPEVTFAAASGQVAVSVNDGTQVVTGSVNANTTVPGVLVGSSGTTRVLRTLARGDFSNATPVTAGVERVGSQAAEGEANNSNVAAEGEGLAPPLDDDRESGEGELPESNGYANAVDTVFSEDEDFLLA